MEKHYQVIIVGGGPVGVALAVDLGLRGISCALVERHLSPQRIPKGQNLTQRTLEHFYFWGVSNELRAARALPPGYGPLRKLWRVHKGLPRAEIRHEAHDGALRRDRPGAGQGD